MLVDSFFGLAVKVVALTPKPAPKGSNFADSEQPRPTSYKTQTPYLLYRVFKSEEIDNSTNSNYAVVHNSQVFSLADLPRLCLFKALKTQILQITDSLLIALIP